MGTRKRRDDTSDERRGFTGAGRRLDEQVYIECSLDDLALVGIRERRGARGLSHSSPRNEARSARRSLRLRETRTPS